MMNIELNVGTSIAEAAAMLVRNAPAAADFNGIRIRARFATTRPVDLVRHYHAEMDRRSVVWQHSPAGKRCAADTEERKASAQRVIDIGLDVLRDLDFVDMGAVVDWCAGMSGAVDRVGVRFDKPSIVATFEDRGWPPGVNCGETFDRNDARNFAGWIVGQWLASWHPIMKKFSDEWRARFLA